MYLLLVQRYSTDCLQWPDGIIYLAPSQLLRLRCWLDKSPWWQQTALRLPFPKCSLVHLHMCKKQLSVFSFEKTIWLLSKKRLIAAKPGVSRNYLLISSVLAKIQDKSSTTTKPLQMKKWHCWLKAVAIYGHIKYKTHAHFLAGSSAHLEHCITTAP